MSITVEKAESHFLVTYIDSNSQFFKNSFPLDNEFFNNYSLEDLTNMLNDCPKIEKKDEYTIIIPDSKNLILFKNFDIEKISQESIYSPLDKSKNIPQKQNDENLNNIVYHFNTRLDHNRERVANIQNTVKELNEKMVSISEIYSDIKDIKNLLENKKIFGHPEEDIEEFNLQNILQIESCYNETIVLTQAEHFRQIGDFHSMVKCYVYASRFNSVDAMLKLARYFKEEQFFHLMEKYYRLACGINSNQAMIELATFHQENKNIACAKLFYKMATFYTGSVKAFVSLGDIYKEECKYDKMKKYYLIAIERGSHSANYKLGHHYQFVEKNPEECIKYYKQAIDKNYLFANHELGYYYETICDYEKMKIFYQKAISHGIKESMYRLGNYYQHIEKNIDEMKKCYETAINLNCKKCKIAYDDFLKNQEQPLEQPPEIQEQPLEQPPEIQEQPLEQPPEIQ